MIFYAAQNTFHEITQPDRRAHPVLSRSRQLVFTIFPFFGHIFLTPCFYLLPHKVIARDFNWTVQDGFLTFPGHIWEVEVGFANLQIRISNGKKLAVVHLKQLY